MVGADAGLDQKGSRMTIIKPQPLDRAEPMRANLRWVLLFAGLIVAPVLADADLPRDTLWMVVRSCGTAKSVFGTPFPCLTVRTGPQGFAVLRAPGSATHLVVTPTVRLSGLESPTVRSSTAAQSWRAALDARNIVVTGAGGRLHLGDVALAINPKRARGQDQLHIHVDCASPEVLRLVRGRASAIGPNWAPLPEPIEGNGYWARRVDRALLRDEDAFASLRKLPKPEMDPTEATFGAVSLLEDGTGDFIHLASQAPRSKAEDVLDSSCAAHVRNEG